MKSFAALNGSPAIPLCNQTNPPGFGGFEDYPDPLHFTTPSTALSLLYGIPFWSPYLEASQGNYPLNNASGVAPVNAVDPTNGGIAPYVPCPTSSYLNDLWFNSQIWQIAVATGAGTFNGASDFSLNPPDPLNPGQSGIFGTLQPCQMNLAALIRGNDYVLTSGAEFKFTTDFSVNSWQYNGTIFSPISLTGSDGTHSFSTTKSLGTGAVGNLSFAGSLSNLPSHPIYGPSGSSCNATLTGVQWT